MPSWDRTEDLLSGDLGTMYLEFFRCAWVLDDMERSRESSSWSTLS